MLPRYFSALIWFVFFLNASSWAQHSSVEARIPAKYKNSIWSVSVRDSQGEEQVNHFSDRLVTPASNLKLLTSAALLSELGPNYSPKTYITLVSHQTDHRTDRKVVFNGDVMIFGTGDPGIGFSKDDKPYDFFITLSDFLKKEGISTISGDLIANISAFDDEMIPAAWEHYDLSFYYAVPISPLAFLRNTFFYQVSTGNSENERRISTFPEFIDRFSIIDKQSVSVRNAKYNEYYRRDLGSYTIHVRSELPTNFTETEYFSVPNPAEYFLMVAKEMLKANGIEIGGNMVISHDPVDRTLADVQIEGKRLDFWLTQINSKSDNFVTEMLVRNALVSQGKDSVGFSDGLTWIKQFASSINLDTTAMALTDASGLSSSNLITPSDLTKMLWKMQDHPQFEVYEQSLGRHGQEGTLFYRFAKRKWKSQFRGKSGYISGSRMLSGYLVTAKGNTVSVSIATNHFVDKVSQIDRIQEEIIDWIYQEY